MALQFTQEEVVSNTRQSTIYVYYVTRGKRRLHIYYGGYTLLLIINVLLHIRIWQKVLIYSSTEICTI